MRELGLTLIVLFAPFSLCMIDRDLHRRVGALERQLRGLEALVAKILENELVDRYGMIRRCSMPTVEHGYVKCISNEIRNKAHALIETDDLVPGRLCSVACEPGYTAKGGDEKKDGQKWITCGKKGLAWSGELRCEKVIPLLVVSGGSNSASVEVVKFHNSSGCDLNIPDIPKTEHGEIRLMHNMFYYPSSPFQLWVCGGLSQSSKASCDSWTYGEAAWKHHSDPNESNMQYSARQGSDKWHLFRSGRYGAASFSSEGAPYIVGGMLNEGKHHNPTNDVRKFVGTTFGDHNLWYGEKKMKLNRALFCVAQFNLTSFVAIGGHSGMQLEKSVEMLMGGGNVADMETARSGLGCVGVEGGKIVVSGGSDKTHRSGGKALATAEMYSAGGNRWERVADMASERYAHALVNVAGRIVAVGGKQWNPDVPLKNAEEFDVDAKTWTSLGDVLSVPRANFGYALIPHSAIPGCRMW